MDTIYVHLMMHDLTNNKLIDSNYSILALDTLYRHFYLTENEIISFLYPMTSTSHHVS